MAMIPTEEEIKRLQEAKDLNEKILELQKQGVEALQNKETIKSLLGDLDNTTLESAQEALLLQQEVFAIEEKKRNLMAEGLTLSTAEELAYQQKLSDIRAAMVLHENVADLINKTRREHEEVTDEIRQQNAEIEDNKNRLEEFKGKADEVSEAFAKIQSVAASISPQLGGMVSSAENFTRGLGEAFMKGQGLGAALYMARTAAEGLLSASVELSKILAEGVRESGLVNFEQMLYDNVDATNQFGMSAAETGKH